MESYLPVQGRGRSVCSSSSFMPSPKEDPLLGVCVYSQVPSATSQKLAGSVLPNCFLELDRLPSFSRQPAELAAPRDLAAAQRLPKACAARPGCQRGRLRSQHGSTQTPPPPPPPSGHGQHQPGLNQSQKPAPEADWRPVVGLLPGSRRGFGRPTFPRRAKPEKHFDVSTRRQKSRAARPGFAWPQRKETGLRSASGSTGGCGFAEVWRRSQAGEGTAERPQKARVTSH